jgi:7-carboxy-7-deazaguanine synthase
VSKIFAVNEVFYSIQGEGLLVGEASVFVRFSHCNLRCDIEPGEKSPGGFACDTEFEAFTQMSPQELLRAIIEVAGDCHWIVATGGEPALQLDRETVETWQAAGFRVAIETNGTRDVSGLDLDWICVSPKVAEHALKQAVAGEVKYVRALGQPIPRPAIKAQYYVLSPAADQDGRIPRENLAWCIDLVKKNPKWRLSYQLHKLWGIR